MTDNYQVETISGHESAMCCCGMWFQGNWRTVRGRTLLVARRKKWSEQHKGHEILCGEEWARGWSNAYPAAVLDD